MAASKFPQFHSKALVFLVACPAAVIRAYIRGCEELANALEDPVARVNRANAKCPPTPYEARDQVMDSLT